MENVLTFISTVFVVGYLAIALEHPLKINKAASALLTGVICWVLYSLSHMVESHEVLSKLMENLSSIAQILFFLIGAMTIVELIDLHKGFKTITDLIKTKDKRKLLWIICFVAFFLSSILDNLTTSIVMVSLTRKLVGERKDRLIFASMIIIAANAGGAWTPIGDVTTTMLWIGGQITTLNIMKEIFIPSVLALVIPLIYQSFFVKGDVTPPTDENGNGDSHEPHAKLILFLGVGALIFVPIFKTITHLPPFIGMLFGLSILWVVSDLLHHKYEERNHLRITHALTRIDKSSILFFLGILLAVGSLEVTGILTGLAANLDKTVGNKDIIVTIIGLASAVIDNVPLVAASMGMYDLATYPVDSRLWEMLAFCAGTGGSILIIGSAAGVVVMGMEKIEFFWYLKRISFTASLGYFAGVIAYVLIV